MDRIRLSRALLICLILSAITFAVYWPVRHHRFTNFDDDTYVSENPHVYYGLTSKNVGWAFRTYHGSNWHPLTWLSHMLDCQLYGLNPMGHHLTNVGFHILNTIVLLLLLRRLALPLWPSAFVAAVFALHPLHVESVAWVSERKDVLSTLFFLLTIWAYVERIKSSSPTAVPEAGASRRFTLRAIAWYLLALFFFVLGLMTKPMLVTLPFVLFLLDYWPLERFDLASLRAQSRRLFGLVMEKVPFLLLAVGSCVVTYMAQRRGGAVLSGEILPLSDRISNAFVSYCRYLGKTFWPENLAAFYPHPGQWRLMIVAGAVALTIGITVAAFVLGRRRRYLLVGWLWFVGTLVPVIGLVQVGQQSMADRYMYIPLIGLAIMVAWGLSDFLSKSPFVSKLLGPAAGLVLVGCVLVTQFQVRYWASSEALFDHALAVTENNPVAHHNLALADARGLRFRSAVAHFKEAIRILPNYARLHNNLGFTYFTMGMIDEAIAEYREALRYAPNMPQGHNNLANALVKKGEKQEALAHYAEALRLNLDFAEIHFDYGTALADEGRLEEAIFQYSEALRVNPRFVRAENNWGVALMKLNKWEEGAAHCRAALKIEPKNLEAAYNLGTAEMHMGRVKEAVAAFSQAITIDPKLVSAHYGMGLAQLQLGNRKAAEEHFSTVLRLEPNNFDAHDQLADLLASQGQLSEAIPHLKAAIAAKPSPMLHFRLASILESQGKVADAIAGYRQALQLNPDQLEALNNLAWLLASHPDSKLRDGEEAVRLAERACELTQRKQPMLIGTLAAAYAEAGKFTNAIAAAEQARKVAIEIGQKEIAEKNGELLELYRSNKAFRQPLP